MLSYLSEIYSPGEVAERLNASVLKTEVPTKDREFESRPLRSEYLVSDDSTALSNIR